MTLMGYLYWVYCIVAVLLMVKVVLNNRDTIKTLAWMLVLLFIPILGLILYFFFGRDTRKIKLIGRRQLSQIKRRDQLLGVVDEAVDVPLAYSPLVSFFRNSSIAYPFPADEIEVITDTSRFASKLMEELERAKEHIHMQFYIIEEDDFGSAVRDMLVMKARQGVEVRVIYDSVGCWSVSKGFFEKMRCAGIYVESFLKVRFPLLTNKVNYRNHRKIVVVDGKVGFVGGCNIADRYINGGKWGGWRDTMLFIRGAAVYGLQSSFLIDWYFSSRSIVSGKRYFPKMITSGTALVQVVDSDPVKDVPSIMSGLVKLLSTARGYVYLQTPYLMPDSTFTLALKSAAISGVDVRIMIPEKSDSFLAGHISMSYIGELLDAGVKVFLYNGGFIHCKTVVCDDNVSSVGSANLDFRSFYLNFEANAFVYDKETALRLKDAFVNDLKSCRQLTAGEYRSRSFAKKCIESAARLLSPLL